MVMDRMQNLALSSETVVYSLLLFTNAGRGYSYAPTIDIVESDVEAFVESDTIGLPRSISIIDNGGAYHLDKTIASTFNSNFVVSLSGNNYTFKKGEIVVQRLSGSEVARAEVVEFRSGGNLLKLENVQGTLRENVEIIGLVTNAALQLRLYLQRLLRKNFLVSMTT